MKVLVLNIYRGKVMPLPEGCTGVCFVFRSKKAARNWGGRDVRMVEITTKDPEATHEGS